MEFMTDPLDLVKFERSVENFKEAITDVYGIEIGIRDHQLARSFTQSGEEVCCQMEK